MHSLLDLLKLVLLICAIALLGTSCKDPNGDSSKNSTNNVTVSDDDDDDDDDQYDDGSAAFSFSCGSSTVILIGHMSSLPIRISK